MESTLCSSTLYATFNSVQHEPGSNTCPRASKGQTTALSARDTTPECQSPGNQIDTIDIDDQNNNKVGEIDVYYNSSNGYNCAYTKSFGSMAGKPQDMQVTITSCQEDTLGGSCTTMQTVTDKGSYSDYAGPVGVYAKAHCIEIKGIIGAYTVTQYADYCR